MQVIKAQHVDHGLWGVINRAMESENSTEGNSRNGPVRRLNGRVSIIWERPERRVSFCPERDANPVFHLFEALWMLAGQNDVKRPSYFASHLATFSDDGLTLNGAYGYRWRKHFGIDQLHDYVIPALRKNREDRRAVMAMWDGDHDAVSAIKGSKDVCCNLMCVFDATSGVLDMTVFNRSNDQVLGACGANIVHFSMLHEYVAAMVGIKMGVYEQISTNSHMYTEVESTKKTIQWAVNPVLTEDQVLNSYKGGTEWMLGEPGSKEVSDSDYQLMREVFQRDCAALMKNYESADAAVLKFETNFFNYVVQPVIVAFNLYKRDHLEAAIEMLSSPDRLHTDWLIATKEWIRRRIVLRNSKILRETSPETAEQFKDLVSKVWPSAEKMTVNGIDRYYITTYPDSGDIQYITVGVFRDADRFLIANRGLKLDDLYAMDGAMKEIYA